MNRFVRGVAAAIAAALCLAALQASASTPACGGITVDGGLVRTVAALAVQAPLRPPALACARAIGARLAGMRQVATVTVAVRSADADRASGRGLNAATAWAAGIAAGGVAAARISAVAPANARGASEVRITYTVRRTRPPVARILTLSGKVRAGPIRGPLRPARQDQRLPPASQIETGPGSRAALALADRSEIHISGGSLLNIGRIHLNSKLVREVRLRLIRGRIESRVAASGKGSVFEIRTQAAVAGVRGTRFRLAVDRPETTRLETIEGQVSLAAGGTSVMVHAGQGASVTKGSKPSQPARLLPEAKIVAPLRGALPADRRLSWRAPDGAARCRLTLARDAYFRDDVREFETACGAWSVPKSWPTGRWFWRIIAIDASGFAGAPSRIHAFR